MLMLRCVGLLMVLAFCCDSSAASDAASTGTLSAADRLEQLKTQQRRAKQEAEIKAQREATQAGKEQANAKAAAEMKAKLQAEANTKRQQERKANAEQEAMAKKKAQADAQAAAKKTEQEAMAKEKAQSDAQAAAKKVPASQAKPKLVDGTDPDAHYLALEEMDAALSLEKIRKLRLNSYYYKFDMVPGRRQIGPIGPDLKKVLPECVTVHKTHPLPNPQRNGPKIIQVENYHSIDYNMLMMHNMAATQELGSREESLEMEVSDLKQQILEEKADYESLDSQLAFFEKGGINGESGVRFVREDNAKFRTLAVERLGSFTHYGTAHNLKVRKGLLEGVTVEASPSVEAEHVVARRAQFNALEITESNGTLTAPTATIAGTLRAQKVRASGGLRAGKVVVDADADADADALAEQGRVGLEVKSGSALFREGAEVRGELQAKGGLGVEGDVTLRTGALEVIAGGVTALSLASKHSLQAQFLRVSGDAQLGGQLSVAGSIVVGGTGAGEGQGKGGGGGDVRGGALIASRKLSGPLVIAETSLLAADARVTGTLNASVLKTSVLRASDAIACDGPGSQQSGGQE